MARTSAHRARRNARAGFTLIELVVVMGMLVVVLYTSYQILNNCLRTERHVEQLTVVEKVGEATMSVMRRDFAGAFYRGLTEQLDRQVFVGINGEGADGPTDEVRFLTTVEPTELQGADSWEDAFEDLKNVTVAGYFLEPNPNLRKYSGYRLYRREHSDFGSGSPLDAPGLNLEVYDKVKSLNFEYYDGYEWLADWSSERQIEAREAALAEEASLQSEQERGIARLSDQNAAGAPDEYSEEVVLPPAAIPTAVRIELEIYAGAGDEIFESNGQPIIRRFRTIVSLFAAQRVAIQIDQEQLAAEAQGAGELGGTDDEVIWGGTQRRARDGGGRGGAGRGGPGRAGPGRGSGRRGGGAGAAAPGGRTGARQPAGRGGGGTGSAVFGGGRRPPPSNALAPRR